jgi:hypothetical protein
LDRTNFFKIVQATITGLSADTKSELDYMWNPLIVFSLNYDPVYYRVVDSDLLRPDIISYRSYSTVEYWWIICLINNIDSPLTDLYLGQILTIPNLLDIYDFQRKYRMRRTS